MAMFFTDMNTRNFGQAMTLLNNPPKRIGLASDHGGHDLKQSLAGKLRDAGFEDDDLNVICLGGLVAGPALAWNLVATFMAARFSGAERHCRRLAKVAALENKENKSCAAPTC